VNRADWQQLAEERARDAEALLAAGCWSGAYYLVGYAVECGLKSCILVRLAAAPEQVFLEKRFSEKCWTHDLEDLVSLADLQTQLAADCAANAALDRHWSAAKDWSEQDRYRMKTEAEARQMVAAVTDRANGVLPWIRRRW
jgi:HEPN domain-containing protein